MTALITNQSQQNQIVTQSNTDTVVDASGRMDPIVRPQQP
jgi:hypothetical protein